MKAFNQFTNLYSVQKTLCFELQPVGRTRENIEKDGLLKQDEERADNYKKVKSFIDEYHKQYIKDRLWNYELPLKDEGKRNSLEEYQKFYELSKRDASQEATFTEIKDNLRAIIGKRLTEKGSAYERIFKKELIREDLIEFLEREEDKELVRQFADFTTYFTGFHENRANMYKDEEQSTSIAYRLIHQNLPKFMDNMKAFSVIAQTPVAEHFKELYASWEAFLNVSSIEEMFRLDYFSQTLTQPHIEVYNGIIGKRILEDGTEIKGINEYVNLYNQQQKDKKQKLPLLVPLYKQILSDRERLSWLSEEFDSDAKMLKAINECYDHLHDLLMGKENESLCELLKHLTEFNLSQINITNDLSLTDISQSMFGRYDVFTTGLKNILRTTTPQKRNENEEAYEDRITKLFKARKSFSIAELNGLQLPVAEDGIHKRVEDYFMSLGAVGTEKNLFEQIEDAYNKALPILQMVDTDDTLSQDKAAVTKIKELLDAFKDLQHFVKPLLGSGEENEKDELFYGAFLTLWDELDAITPLYNKVRNWLTRKPYSTEKIKLNFDNAQLLAGWDLNKEVDNTCTLLRKDGLYYLAIINKQYNKVLTAEHLLSDGDCYEKMVYKQLGQISQQLPRIAFSNSWKKRLTIPAEVIQIKQTESFKTNNNDLQKLIAYYKYFISQHEEWNSFFNISFTDRDNYRNLPDFYSEVDTLFYSLSFTNVSVAYINQLIDEGKLYLFRIWNKDFSEYSKGTPNLHTLYWKMLFDKRNLEDVVFKLNGQAEVFYRKASIKQENRIIHPAHQAINNKNPLNRTPTSTFEYDIIKNKRYTVDKFLFHVPITINFKAKGLTNINPLVLDAIRKGGFSHIIGIDRGERHLLYLSLIDLQGNIVKQMTLNEIINVYKEQAYVTNYHNLLAQKEGDRTKARRSWDTIENIKELKEGYLSQVVHVISKMVVEYHAIVVLEDLNMGFMRSRQKIERQVYEKFEKMLIDKLNCYIDKQADPASEGGMLHALQLTNKFESFRKMGKQSGCLFYIPAWNTSKIDPVTGFVNFINPKYESIQAARDLIGKFEDVRYNPEQDYFEFHIKDYSAFNPKAKSSRQEWVICTKGTRIRTFRNPDKNNEWDSEEIVLTEKFKELFDSYGIDYRCNLLASILIQTKKDFFHNEDVKKPSLLPLLKLTLQLRNSHINSEVDYILSPVADTKGNFYDSRTCGPSLPDNADANGAFNIARKGLMLVERIRAAKDDEKPALTITNEDWLHYAQNL